MPDPITPQAPAPQAPAPAPEGPRRARVSNSPAPYREGLPHDHAGMSERSAEDAVAKLLNPKIDPRRPDPAYDELPPEERAERDAEYERRNRDSRRVEAEREGLGDGETVNEEVAEPDDDRLPASLDDGDDDQNPEDWEEVEYEAPNGKKYTIPKPLVDGAMMQNRFTQAMEEVATQRSYMATYQQNLELERSMFQELEPVNAQLRQIDATITALQEQLPNPNDPANVSAYLTLDKQIRDLDTARQRLAQSAAERRTELASQKQALVGALQDAADKMLAKALPKWNGKVKQAVVQRLAESGYTPQEIGVMYDPRLLHLAHDAAMYHSIVARKNTTRRQVQAAPPVVRPQGRPSTAQTETGKARAIVKEARRTGDPRTAEAAITALLMKSRAR